MRANYYNVLAATHKQQRLILAFTQSYDHEDPETQSDDDLKALSLNAAVFSSTLSICRFSLLEIALKLNWNWIEIEFKSKMSTTKNTILKALTPSEAVSTLSPCQRHLLRQMLFPRSPQAAPETQWENHLSIYSGLLSTIYNRNFVKKIITSPKVRLLQKFGEKTIWAYIVDFYHIIFLKQRPLKCGYWHIADCDFLFLKDSRSRPACKITGRTNWWQSSQQWKRGDCRCPKGEQWTHKEHIF